MTSSAVPLEIHVHLQDGKIVKFAQSSPELADSVVDRIQPSRLFAQHHIIIGGEASMTAFQSASVVRVDLVTERRIEWPFHYGASDIREISEGEFRERYRPDVSSGRAAPAILEDGTLVTFNEIEMTNGERIFVEVHIVPEATEARGSLDQGVFIQQLFSSGGLHARRRGNGVMIVNPINIVRSTFYPGPSAIPRETWPAQRMRD